LHKLLRHPPFRDQTLAKAADRRSLVLEYLRQIGINAGSKRIGVVDVGWQGRLQNSLSQIMNSSLELSEVELSGYYYCLRRSSAQQHPASAKWSFTRGLSLFQNDSLMEVFTAADHGSVRSFHRANDGGIKPVFVGDENGPALDWGLKTQQNGILAFVNHLVLSLDPDELSPWQLAIFLHMAGQKAFERFTQSPSPEEAIVYGRFLHAIDQSQGITVEVAPQYNGKWLPVLTTYAGRAQAHILWPQGTIRRSRRSSAGLFLMAYKVYLWLISIRRLLRKVWSELLNGELPRSFPPPLRT
jgi:hypothetical protein